MKYLLTFIILQLWPQMKLIDYFHYIDVSCHNNISWFKLYLHGLILNHLYKELFMYHAYK